MFPQRDEFIELLAKHGWEIVETQKKDDHWVVEQWLVKSIWSPTACRVFLTFEIEPQLTPGKTSEIWGVRAGLNQPPDWAADNRAEFVAEIEADKSGVGLTPVGRRSEKYLPAFFDELANLRTKFDNLKK
ncbi:MAG: hypothetical protein M3384_04195 [Acidobacteriota bacterium]|nr:hypothetical protein [Acidobacteriota bacterium]